MKFLRPFLCGAAAALIACGCSSTDPKPISRRQAEVTTKASSMSNAVEQPIFPVMAWNSAPNDPAVLKKMKECGLTVAGFVAPGTLDACQAAGLKGIVWDARTMGYDWTKVDANVARSNVASVVAETGKHPATYGYYLRDEPGADFFPGLATVAGFFNEMAPGKWAYINCFPNYAENWQMHATNYNDYLEQFVNTIHPTTLSYDHYSIMDDGSLRDVYWSNLEQMSAVARKYNLPFWNIVLSVGSFNFREPTAADFQFQVYSSLAYGAKGIAYFTYFAPQVGNYRMAPIDQFGNETANWHNMQNVNLQIQKLAPTLLQLKCDEVYHFGSIPSGCKGPSTNSLVTTVGGQMVVGDFTHKDGTRYVMLVNKDVQKSIPCGPQFRKAPRKVLKVSPYTGDLVAFEGEQVWLAPGAGVLLRVEQ
ncbi:hypothetical protein [Pedosphaera parvula]|nr:hypothetical protein [Pedosphaera parvula]